MKPSTSAVRVKSLSGGVPKRLGTRDRPIRSRSQTAATPSKKSTAAGSVNAYVSGSSKTSPSAPTRPRLNVAASGSGPA
jgi:hypothetical protein